MAHASLNSRAMRRGVTRPERVQAARRRRRVCKRQRLHYLQVIPSDCRDADRADRVSNPVGNSSNTMQASSARNFLRARTPPGGARTVSPARLAAPLPQGLGWAA